MKRARLNPTRWSVQRSWRSVLPSSASSHTWIPKPCWELLRSVATGGLWPATQQFGLGCCWRTPGFLLRWGSKCWYYACFGDQPFESRGTCSSCGDVFFCSIFLLFFSFFLKFLTTLSQWCTQTHSLILQNLKPRQRGKKESKEDYLKSTRWETQAGHGRNAYLLSNFEVLLCKLLNQMTPETVIDERKQVRGAGVMNTDVFKLITFSKRIVIFHFPEESKQVWQQWKNWSCLCDGYK